MKNNTVTNITVGYLPDKNPGVDVISEWVHEKFQVRLWLNIYCIVIFLGYFPR